MTASMMGLLAAHMIADFPAQADWMANNKHDQIEAKLAHCSVHSLITFTILTVTEPVEIAAVAGATIGMLHFIVDSLPRAEKKEGFELYPFTVDQSLHALTLWVVAVMVL